MIHELRPIPIHFDEWDDIEQQIKELFKEELYYPLLKEWKQPKKVLKNSLEDLLQAIQSGRLSFYRGKFSGPLNASLTKELRKLGATWDRRLKCYSIPYAELPVSVKSAVSTSASFFESKMASIDRKLAAVVPEKLAERLKVSKLFDQTIWKVEDSFQDSVKKLRVAPKLTATEASRLSSEWENNMKLWIRNFTADQIQELRSKMKANILKGNRYESMIQTIQDSYGVTARKARFLARQETNLMMSKFKEVRYASVGVREYKWKAVIGTEAHPTRKRHKYLSELSDKGHLFQFDKPPNTAETNNPKRGIFEGPGGYENNPGEDFNCLLEDSVIKLAHGIRRVFRREYTGKLAVLVTHSGRKFIATLNHPILTTKGWKPIGSLNEFDDLVCIKQQVLDSIKGDHNHGETTIGEIFTSFSNAYSMQTLRGMSHQFHGDGFEGNINIVKPASSLSIGLKPGFLQKIKQFFFSQSDSSDFSFRSTFMNSRQPSLSFLRILKNFSDSVMCFSNNPFSLLRILKTNQIGFAYPSNRYSFGDQSISDHTPRAIEAFRNRLFAFTRLISCNHFFKWNRKNGMALSNTTISLDSSLANPFRKVVGMSADDPTDLIQALSRFQELDRVKNRSIIDFSGHVYNLETASHWYIGDANIVQMNCRCVALPVVRFQTGGKKK